jgi:murein DD-endopeptidase MepM/ murein hydrolase activator NlpD
LGKTGYATGYHLHWEMRVNNVAIDPLQWTQNTF